MGRKVPYLVDGLIDPKGIYDSFPHVNEDYKECPPFSLIPVGVIDLFQRC